MAVRYMDCCGWREISGLSLLSAQQLDTFFESTVSQIIAGRGRFSRLGCGALVFTSTNDATYGPNFAAYLQRERVGEVSPLPTFRNPNTGNIIHTWMWRPSLTGIRAWQRRLQLSLLDPENREALLAQQAERRRARNARRRQRYAEQRAEMRYAALRGVARIAQGIPLETTYALAT